MKRLLPLLFISLFQIVAFSQTFEEKQIITKDYNNTKLEELAKSFKEEAEHKKTRAVKQAKQNGWVVRYEEDGKLFELMDVSEEGIPLYYTTNNVNAAKSTRANTLHNGGILGLNVVGQNMEAHVWDGGLARSSHQEYDGAGGSNRFSIGDGTTTLHYHSAHVTGTIIASGYVSNAKGMAPQADAIGYEWNYDVSEATSAANSGMLLSNHSYGWDATTIPDWYFGAYNYRSREWDVVMHNAPYYLMVVSAGNDGNDNTSNGNPLDGNSSYDKLSGFKTSKNNLTVANGQDANIDANGNLISVYINSSSSEGPTDDYRIKPDITGNGTSLYSTFEGYNSEYGNLTGTSMAAPNVTGTLLLLQQHYNNTNASYMLAATLKGLALHTADDAGPSGPDSKYGWGLLNAKAAANTITNEGVESTINELVLNNGNSYTINVNSDGINDLVASISWTDPAGQANNGTANDPTPVLVNDLDIRVTKGGSTYYPYRLTSITTNGTGDNIVDPFEKTIVSGASGSYTITVTHKGNLSGGNQNFSLIVTGLTISSSPPVANFNADDTAPIIGQTVTFTDLSTNSPTTWQWSFSGPGNVVFVNGTNATSTNPKVQFDALGFYTATLTVSNAYGNDTETKTNYIEVVEAGALDPPTNLTAQVVNEDDVLLNWTAPSGGGGQGEWIQWDDGVNAGNGIGLTAGGTFYVASHWNPSDLTGYNGMSVTQMSFFPYGDPNATFTLKIWIGANAATEVMSQNVGSFTVDEFNIVNLNNPITINPSTEYWFGYEVTHAEGTNPAGVDAGPAVQEMGDMISFGSNSWTGMSAAYGLDFNWNIAIYVDDSKNAAPPQVIVKTTFPVSNGTFKENGATGTIKAFNPNPTKALTGYNIYRDGAFIGYTTQTTYTDSNLENGTYDYCATAVYDEGESNCSNTASATISTGGILNPPTNLTAQIVNNNDVNLNWTAPSGGGEDFFEGFESGTLPTGWLAIDNDGDGYNWENTIENGFGFDAYEGAGAMTSASFINDVGALTPDNYLITPAIEIGSGSTLSYWHDAQDADWPDDFYYVKLSTTGTNLSDFTETLWSGTTPADWAEVTIDLSSYAGNNCHIAFQHTNCTDWFYMKIDNFSVSNTKTQSLFTPFIVGVKSEGMPFRTSGMDVDEINTAIAKYQAETGSAKALTGYNIYRNGVLIDYTTQTTYTDTDLENGSYDYCATAVYDEGESVCSNIANVVIEDCIPEPPASLGAAIIDEVNVQLIWFAPSCEDLLGYNIYRNDENIDFVTSTEYLDENLENGTYSYCVTAVYDEGETDCSNTATVTIFVCIPDPPTNLTAVVIDLVNVQLDWDAPSCEDLLGYNIYRNDENIDFVTSTNYYDDNLDDGTYDYCVTAVYDEGETDCSNIASVIIEGCIPDPPSNLSATIIDDINVQLNWDAPTCIDLLGYNIYRNDENIDFTTSTEYLDENLENGTYDYCVTAVYDEGETDCSNTASATIYLLILNPPTNLIGTVEYNDITLCWDAPSGNGGEWIHWDSGENAGNGIGLTNGGTFFVASHWTASELVPYVGMSVSQMSFFPYGDPAATYVLKVWTGPNAGTEVMSQDINSFNPDQWNEVDLTDPVMITSSTEYWFGYAITHSEGTNPAGVDVGPAVQGSGDMISLNGSSWVSMGAEYSFDFNWNIQVFVENLKNATPPKAITKTISNTTGGTLAISSKPNNEIISFTPASAKDLLGYNVYRDGTLLVFTTENCMTDDCLPPGTTPYTYCVTALYDEGESECSNQFIFTIPILPAPENLAYSLDENNVILEWDAVKGFDGYNVYHSFNSGGFELLNSEPLSGNTYDYDDAAIGYHEFYVKALYCEWESDPSNTVQFTIVGIEENLSDNIKVYPNPAHDFVNINSETVINNIKVFSNIGQLVLDIDVKENDYKVNMSGFENGVYLIKIETEKGISIKRIIKR